MRVDPKIDDSYDLAIVGAGAAGLAGAIFAGESARGSSLRIILIESAKKPGAKILVSGGGRCNVTNETVAETDFWGGSSHIIRKVLREFGNRETIDWFRRMGVALKCEDSGKYFPESDRAQTILSALLNRVRELGVELVTGYRVTTLQPLERGFSVLGDFSSGTTGMVMARRVIIATGGLALPKSGSDGAGLSVMRELGHTIIPTTPALAPLILLRSTTIGGRFAEFGGITLEARLRLCRGHATTPIAEITGSLVFTHFGISGPAAMDLSRHYLRAQLDDPPAPLRVYFGVPSLTTVAHADRWLRDVERSHPRRLVATALEGLLPSRLARALADETGTETVLADLPRDRRRHLAEQLVQMPLDVTGTRGFTHAETTAGGVDLHDVRWQTMESRKVPGLHLCGEILNVDGRIGGFNFQWAWSSAYLAGRGAVDGLT